MINDLNYTFSVESGDVVRMCGGISTQEFEATFYDADGNQIEGNEGAKA